MALTPEDIAQIKSLIREALSSLPGQPKAKTRDDDYHTAPRIRKIILNHIKEFQEFVGEDEFHISALRTFVKRRTKLTDADKKIVGTRKGDQQSKFDHQLHNAISQCNSASSPFVCVRRGHYRLRLVASQLEI